MENEIGCLVTRVGIIDRGSITYGILPRKVMVYMYAIPNTHIVHVHVRTCVITGNVSHFLVSLLDITATDFLHCMQH